MTEILILYILSKYDATIYKIKKLIEEKFFMLMSPSLGAVTPALKKLETLSCVEFETKMSDGGMLSKTYKITPSGMKYLKSQILSFEFKNKAHILNNISLLICVSDILDENDKEELFKTFQNHLLLLKTDTENALENPYLMYNDIQKDVVKSSVASVNKLLEALQ